MTSTYTVHPAELTMDFIRSVQAMFQNKEIEINIREISDETDYLFSSPANKAHLLQSLAQAENHDELVTIAESSL